MPSEYNKGRARELIESAPKEGTTEDYLRWVLRAVGFLLNRYLLSD